MAFGIPNIEQKVSNFLEGGTGITSIRSVDFDKNYLWMVEFVDNQQGDANTRSLAPNAPFDTFFPASDVTIPFANLNTTVRSFGQTELETPRGGTAKTISITFYDSMDRILQRYFKDWMELDIKNNGNFMSGIYDSHQAVDADSFGEQRGVYPTRKLRLVLWDSFRSTVSEYNFRVFPKDDFDFTGSQNSEATTYTVNFAVVEDLSSKPFSNDSFGGFSLDTVKGVLGRFI